MSDKKIRTYRINVDGIDEATRKYNALADAISRTTSKAEARYLASQIAKQFGDPRLIDQSTEAINRNTEAREKQERQSKRMEDRRKSMTLGVMSNLGTNDPGALYRSAELIGSTSLVYPAQLPYAQRMLAQGGRMPPIRQDDIDNRALAAAIGVPFNRFLPQLLNGIKTIAQLDKKLERALSTVTSTSAGRAYGLNLARNYVAIPGASHYGQLRLRNPGGLSNYEMAFLGDMYRSPVPLSASDLAYGHRLRGPIQPALPANGMPQGDVQLWQRSSRVLQEMRRKHLTYRMVAQRELHPISRLMLPSEQIEAALAQSAYRPNVVSSYGRQVAEYAGFNNYPGWGSMPSMIPHMTAEGVGLNLQDVPIKWHPRKKKPQRFSGRKVDSVYQYLAWASESGVSMMPWDDSLSGTANRFLEAGQPIFSPDIQENLSNILHGAKRGGRKTLSRYDLSNTSVSFEQWMNALSNPDYLYSNPFTSEQNLVRSFMPNRRDFADSPMGNNAYTLSMNDFFTNPRLFKSLGDPAQAAEYAGVLGRYIPQAARGGAGHEQIMSLTNSLVELMDFAFPGLTHNSLGRQEADAKAFAKVLGGSDMVEALSKTIGEAYERAIISADVKTELRYNPESRMPMYAGGMNIVPHMLRAFDMMLAGTSDRYSPMGLAARAMKHQGMSSRQMSQLLGMDMGDEGDFVRTHKVPIPEEKLPFVGLPGEHNPVDWTKGTVTPGRYQFAKMVKEMSKTMGKERVWDIMTQIARTGTGSNVAKYLNQRTTSANADIDEMSIFPGDVMADALIQEENITTDMRLRGGGAAGAPLKYGQESFVEGTHVISKGVGTEGRRRPKMPKRAGVLNKAFEILNQKTLKQLLPIGLAAGIGIIAEHFMPGAGMMMGGMMAGVTTGGNWNDFIAQYTAENPVPSDPEEKKKYYELARAIHSGPPTGGGIGGSSGVQSAAQMLASGGLGGAGSSNAQAKTIKMTNAYKDMISLATPTTPGATGARVGIEMQYPISEKGSAERLKVDARMTETLDKLSKLGFERIGSKAEMASYGDRAYSNKFAVAGGKIDYSKPDEAKIMLENAAKVISESGAENIFFNKTETNRHETGVMNAISTLMGKSPGTSGEGLGKTNVMSIKGKFAFTPEQAEQMKTVREQLQGMGKDIQITEYQTSELDDANQRVSKSYLEVDQNIPLNKTNEYGKTIEDSVTGFGQQTTGIEGSIKAMRTYDDSMENSTTWTDKLISKGKDINKFSWQLTMLSLGALGVYFSMMGLVGLIKQGAMAAISPLQDLEGMIKNSVLADVFGFGSTGNLSDKIGASFAVQGAIASFTDALASLGASIFGDPEVMASIQDTFKTIQNFFEDPNTKQTVKDIFVGLAEAVKTIADNAGPVLEVLKAGVTPIKKWPVVGPTVEKYLPDLGNMSGLSTGLLAAAGAIGVMAVGSIASFAANVVGKAAMWIGKGIQYGQKGYGWISKIISGPTAAETIGDTAAKIAAGGPIGQTATDQTSWVSKLFGKKGGGAAAGLAFTSQDWRMMTATSDEERANILKEWNITENPLEWMKQQVSGGIGYRTKQIAGEEAWPDWMEASQKDTSKNWFMGMDLAGLFGGESTGTDQTDTIAKKIAAEVPVNQTITVTFVIQGNMDQKAGETSISSLADFLKAYAKGNTPGSG